MKKLTEQDVEKLRILLNLLNTSFRGSSVNVAGTVYNMDDLSAPLKKVIADE